jgi:hypothetical protein
MSSVSIFVKAFDPMNSQHVMWLKKMTDLAGEMNDPTKQYSLVKEINSNPMNVSLDSRDALMWVEIHFALAMRYTQAVLNSKAIVPATSLSPISE